MEGRWRWVWGMIESRLEDRREPMLGGCFGVFGALVMCLVWGLAVDVVISFLFFFYFSFSFVEVRSALGCGKWTTGVRTFLR